MCGTRDLRSPRIGRRQPRIWVRSARHREVQSTPIWTCSSPASRAPGGNPRRVSSLHSHVNVDVSQIASFLGPAKSPSASASALATLLPGPILVDSHRTTQQGKVKLKLSLLGVRVTKCPICLGQFKDKEKGVMMPECGHVAHEGCARRWFREDWRCFVCRVALKGESERGLVE